MTVNINGVLFHIQKIDEQIIVTFETINKEVVEIPYDRKVFLKYFSLGHAMRLENYLQEFVSAS